jgi:cysteine desulfurase
MIYLDNAASTRPAPEVLEAYTRAATALAGNPSSSHGIGAAAARALDAAREQVAAFLGAEARDVVFTSGGTEANALGLLGAAGAARGRHLVVTAIEHPAVLRSAAKLSREGYELTLVQPDATGVVSTDAVVTAVRPDTAAVAVMLVNNELGTLQPVQEVARSLRAKGFRSHLHVDAVQAAGFVPIDVRTLGADSVALSGHKIHGLHGTGALWVRTGARLRPLWDGGRQERGLRSGTENVPGCVALGRAAFLGRERLQGAEGVAALRDHLERLIGETIAGARPTVSGSMRAAHITSVFIPHLPAEPILHALEARGVYASAGAACAARGRERSHVLEAIGVAESAAVLRFSLSHDTTRNDVESAAAALADAVAEVRQVVQGQRSR